MSRQMFHCPKCGKLIRRISMSGGSLIDQGLPVPDPEDFCIMVHPCRCSSAKGEPNFQTFLNCWKMAYDIRESKMVEIPVATKPFAANVTPFQRPIS
jgi:hypothetical protein